MPPALPPPRHQRSELRPLTDRPGRQSGCSRQEPAAQPDAATQPAGSQPADDARLLRRTGPGAGRDHRTRRAAAARPAPTAPPLPISAPRSRPCVTPSSCLAPSATEHHPPGQRGPDAPQPASPPPGAAQDGATAAAEPLRRYPGRLRRPAGCPGPARIRRPGPARRSRAATDRTPCRLLDQAAAEAQACARWYRDTPEWQRMSRIGRATRELLTAIRESAGDYWAEIRLDIRVRGFARTLAARASLAVSGAAHLLAGRLERAGHRNTTAVEGRLAPAPGHRDLRPPGHELHPARQPRPDGRCPPHHR